MAQSPARYTLLLGKPFPLLKAFTLAFWMKLGSPPRPKKGTVISYKQGRDLNLFRVVVSRQLELHVHGEVISVNLNVNASTWTYVAWSWDSHGE